MRANIRALIVIVLATSTLGCQVAIPTPTPSDAVASTAPSSAPTPSGEATKKYSAWEELRQRINEAGDVTPEIALAEYATMLGPVPGAQPVAGDLPPELSGSMVVRHVLRFWDVYTDEQRGALNESLFGPLRDPTPSPVGLVQAAGIQVAQTDFQSELDSVALRMESLLGFELPPIKYAEWFVNVPQSVIRREVIAFAAPAVPSGQVGWQAPMEGQPWTCVVSVMPAHQDLAGTELERVLAHEVFHCFQFNAVPLPRFYPLPDWLVEGSAEWAGDSYAVIGGSVDDWWRRYLQEPSALFDRTYDALGFYAHLFDVGVDPWPAMARTFKEVGASGDPLSAFAIITDSPKFLDTWPTSLARNDNLGPEWAAYGPLMPELAKRAFEAITVGPDESVPLTAPKGVQKLFLLQLPLEGVLQVDVFGFGGWTWSSPGSQTTLFGGSYTKRWLMNPSERCPDGSAIAEADPAPASTAFVAITGTIEESAIAISMLSPDEACQKEPSAPPSYPPPPIRPTGQQSDKGSANAAGSTGDTHIDTFDDLRYDLQLVGEFVLVRSLTDDLEVQSRQKPFGDRVAVNAAVAVRVAGDRVIFDGNAGILVNGVETVITESPLILPGGGRISRPFGDHVIEWPDGSRLMVTPGLPDPIMLLAPARQGQVVGLWGNFDGDPANDLASRDGTTIPPDSDEPAIYATVGNAWRLTQAESLFEYGPGETTETFTDLSFPHDIVALEGLDQAARERAEGICRAAGVAEAEVLEGCILDVVVTGDDSYAMAAARVHAGTRRVTLSPDGHLGNDMRADVAAASDSKPVVAYYVYGRVSDADSGQALLSICGDALCASITTRELLTTDDAFVRMGLAPGDLPVVALTDGFTDAVTLVQCLDPECAERHASQPPIDAVWQLAIASDGRPWVVDRDNRLLHCADAGCSSAADVDLAGLIGSTDLNVRDVAMAAGDRLALTLWQYGGDRDTLQLVVCRDSSCSAVDAFEAAVGRFLPGPLQIATDGRPYFSFASEDDVSGLGTENIAICRDVGCAELDVVRVWEWSATSHRYRITAAAVGGDGLLTVLGTTFADQTGLDEWRLLECGDHECRTRTELRFGPAEFQDAVAAAGTPTGTPIVLFEAPACLDGDLPGCGIGLLIPGSSQ